LFELIRRKTNRSRDRGDQKSPPGRRERGRDRGDSETSWLRGDAETAIVKGRGGSPAALRGRNDLKEKAGAYEKNGVVLRASINDGRRKRELLIFKGSQAKKGRIQFFPLKRIRRSKGGQSKVHEG